MDRSPYLTQALQSMSAAPAPQSAPGLDPQAIAAAVRKRDQWKAANPGQSYTAHSMGQAGQSLMAAPGRMVDGFKGMFGR
jgi:hypothetical protein